ncbi:unnamed protein product (plasmid) [Mycetohabitans rhizoxinica HKI 454]|uniref:Uncharacterized protein n=1 Tax=Mycetohabitans rhizoxinica (strain DSM 19002 / CIP 109453 / HKI 454) TaxID=882378 RepID=E5AW99_MYCRK|nr:unnamed protein product [Mycetohabitans rhizoxinica HKI 454]
MPTLKKCGACGSAHQLSPHRVGPPALLGGHARRRVRSKRLGDAVTDIRRRLREGWIL